jgi:predicted nucleotidyltransferase
MIRKRDNVHEKGRKGRMNQDTEFIFHQLINHLSNLQEVCSIGISGSKSPLPKAGESDIDIFVYCNELPDIDLRKEVIQRMEQAFEKVSLQVFEKGHWGTGDLVHINGVETWIMFFTKKEALSELEAILNGEYPDKLDNYYYPIGRCAMLLNMNILYDKDDFLQAIKNKLAIYPERLARQLSEYHMEKLEDVEDLERAVHRKDTLFYHFALDLSLDHFLQGLFALNETYFPSRKRSLIFIEKFKIKPDNCGARLQEIIRLGGIPEQLEQSYLILIALIEELHSLINLKFRI